jgi:long-chain acyl-CoA synthetase
MYADSAAEEMIYILTNADVRMALVEDQEQVDKLIEIKDRCPLLEQVIFEESRGLRHYDYPYLSSYQAVQQAGREYAADHPDFLDQRIAEGKGDDIASMSYTSGTTGNPKGVVLTYNNLILSAANASKFEGLREDEEILAYLPMAWIGQSVFSYAQHYVTGYCVNCPESSDTVMTDLREIAPTYFFAPPRIYENLLTQVMIRIEDAGKFKQKLFHYFMAHAKRVGIDILEGKTVSAKDRWLYRLGEALIYGPLKNVLGFSKIRLAYTAGEAIGPDIFEFYRSLGVNIKQLYGSTEASVFVCIQPDGEIKPDTVGKPAIDVEVRITDSGEILFRSPGVFHSYYKNPQATADTKDSEGWVHTGDAGFFDGDGHLKIIDRAKDVGKLTDGSLFAPKYIENKLKFFPYIKEAVAFGHAQDHVNVFINIDLEAVGNWAERHNLAYSGYADLAARDEVYGLIRDCVAKVNADLAEDANLAGCQIKRFLILHKELDADDGELTRTSKVRRGFIADKYRELVDALYSGVEHQAIETEMTFEDGRTGTVRADVKIHDAERFAIEELRKAS